MESYKHLFAKQTLARWLADPDQTYFWNVKNSGGGLNNSGVFVEYPICLDSEGHLHGVVEAWHEAGINGNTQFENDVPTYQQCIDGKLLPICIFDVAVRNIHQVLFAYEIVHKNDISPEKHAYIQRIAQESALWCVWGLDADWVLSQTKPPAKLKSKWQLKFWG